jgi:hypothetical protein
MSCMFESVMADYARIFPDILKVEVWRSRDSDFKENTMYFGRKLPTILKIGAKHAEKHCLFVLHTLQA